MENKNLNDIIIEDAETSKGNQLKNILTLLALLFIILVISIVITKLKVLLFLTKLFGFARNY